MVRLNPRYVRRGGEICMSVPARLEGTRFHVFALQADAAPLRDLVTRYLVAPSGGATDFEALPPYVFLYFADISAASSDHPHERAMGGISYREVGTMIPVYDRLRAEVSAFIPYIWVDSAHAMCTGREIFGYPKALGEITAGTLALSSELTLRTPLLDGRVAGSVAAHDKLSPDELIRVSPPSEHPDQVDTVGVERFVERCLGALPISNALGSQFQRVLRSWRPGMAVRELRALLPELGARFDAAIHSPTYALARFIIELLSRGRLPVVLLKQVRDACEPDRACYQGIVRSTLRASAIHDVAVLPPGYSVRIRAA